jgi:hypothetical protein
MKITYSTQDGTVGEILGDMPHSKTSITILFGGNIAATFSSKDIGFITVEPDSLEQPFTQCFPDTMGATHEGDNGKFYKHVPHEGYMVLESNEWMIARYMPGLRRLDDIRTTVQQKYEIQKLSTILKELNYEIK